ncbi:uncharacterized protein AMSG_00077 [Thecamonas trahens ATCC 50062]|uniref:Uncharacterized protein n=1 Tax=Thecamonas trahens ATCC 50062 TaxID=461836 RepID=A0A0L0D137_THETB|nr:hypothetical protein AMSG_00077 [Thecamonas trahens ATCC 50062]KNC45962.1 hypothetical protein AMSG_00077 [Thecamonas trahens ATCC 50062]|eukprot:XP_013762943.1 hypothetical protein AMSG_00077 [Thecamonas trahens ATCC 50062]
MDGQNKVAELATKREILEAEVAELSQLPVSGAPVVYARKGKVLFRTADPHKLRREKRDELHVVEAQLEATFHT